MGLVPFGPHGQKARRLVDDDDVPVFVQKGQPFWPIFGRSGAFLVDHVCPENLLKNEFVCRYRKSNRKNDRI